MGFKGDLMRVIKVFKTSEMPENIAKIVSDCGLMRRDEFVRYDVDYFFNEAVKNKLEGYNPEEVQNIRLFDKWLKANGAENHETILIEHG
jgi:hypothetical protein